MTVKTTEELRTAHCAPCEGGVPGLGAAEAEALVRQLDGWQLVREGSAIRKSWTVRNFLAGIAFIERVARLAEQEGHHPDLHLERYRHLAIELTTHAIGGLSENDFILAAKIDTLPMG